MACSSSSSGPSEPPSLRADSSSAGVEAGPSHHLVPQRPPSAVTTADTGLVPKRKECPPEVAPSDGSWQGLGALLPPCRATGRRGASHPRRSALPRSQANYPRAASCPSPRSPPDDWQAGDAIAGGRTRPEQGSTARVGGGVQVGLPTLALLSSSDGCASIGCRGVPAGHCQGTACGGVAYCTEHLFVCLECGCFPYCLVCVTGSHGCRRPPRPPPPPPVLLGPTGADYDAALASAAKDATLQQHGGGSHGSDEVPAPRLVRYSVLVSWASRPVLDGRAINFYYRELPHVDWGNIAASNEIDLSDVVEEGPVLVTARGNIPDDLLALVDPTAPVAGPVASPPRCGGSCPSAPESPPASPRKYCGQPCTGCRSGRCAFEKNHAGEHHHSLH